MIKQKENKTMQAAVIRMFLDVGSSLTKFPIQDLELCTEPDGSKCLQYFDGSKALKLVPCQKGYDVAFNFKEKGKWKAVEAYCTNIDLTKGSDLKTIVTKTVKAMDALYIKYWRTKDHA